MGIFITCAIVAGSIYFVKEFTYQKLAKYQKFLCFYRNIYIFLLQEQTNGKEFQGN